MSRVCSICGKGKMNGKQVSHSKRHSNRVWNVNLQKVKINVDGDEKSRYVCTKCLKSSNRE